jgi:type II secretory pathway pseudopilin PulG
LAETLIVVALVGILAALAVAAYNPILARAARVKCTSNLRALHSSFDAYVLEKGHWPQPPDYDLEIEEKYEDWLLKEMGPYTDHNPNLWLCPVLVRAQLTDDSGRPIRVHYIPTQFDANRISPYRWPRQPWLIEIADAHGTGPLILFTDGTISDLHTILDGE